MPVSVLPLVVTLLPGPCPGCGGPGPAPCAGCRRALVPAGRRVPPPAVDGCAAAFVYAEVGRRLVTSLKYRNQRSVVPWAGRVLAELLSVAEPTRTVPHVDAGAPVVTWPPTAGSRRRARGYDQARLLARATAGSAGMVCRPLLARVPGPSQTGRTREERLTGPVFRARGAVPPAVVLVDDVVTTGATLGAAARALRAAGAEEVLAVVLAATP